MTVTLNQAVPLEGNATGASARPQETIAPPDSLYIPSLDGIRAISFFLVFFSHAGMGDLVPGGFGVTVFFLLSGFLITTLLRAEFNRHGRISLKNFYLRRLLRIFPPLYITLVLALVLCQVGEGHPPIPVPGTVAQALQVSNYFEIFAQPSIIMPGTGVLWSLAVEEHFYLIFPLLYIWMSPRFSGHRQALLLLGLCAAALAWRCVLHFYFHASFIRTYYGTDVRFDSILLGCVFAIVANPVMQDPLHAWFLRRMKWLLPISVAVLLGTFVVRNESFRETLRYTLQGLALVPLFIAAIYYQKSLPVRLLNLPWVRFLGVLSYSLYLCHAVIMSVFERIWPTNLFLARAVALGCALCFATLVHYWIERPCAKARKRLSKVLATKSTVPIGAGAH
ncbi:MAG TPA: acyltransferase [Steroidobacteraceae bacterium]|jgi:peptidoglycan/LPS O-acetylase OafA/YrhL